MKFFSVTTALLLAASTAFAPTFGQDSKLSSEAAESVTVTATPLPGRSAVDEFIYSYPKENRATDRIARWKNGICPVVEGVPPRYAAFIATRLIAIAKKAEAPVNSDPKCRHNIQILFTPKPQETADYLRNGHAAYLGWFDNLNQRDQLATVTHDIQAWYLTASVTFGGAMWIDDPRATFRNVGTTQFTGANGNYIHTPGLGRLGGGIASSLHNVIIVADSGKLQNYEIGALADYIAMLALSQPKRFDQCWEVPSITNLLSKDCEPSRKTATLSDNDSAFLYGLYKMGSADAIWQQRAEIRYLVQRNKERR
jgi:hypothetical protein